VAIQLRLEADRAIRLDEELRECRETLDKEKFMRQNADLALRSVTERGKDEEVARRELQQALESVSSRDTASNSIISNLRNEKVTLERRMRELEANLQQVVSAATPKRKGRARSSSLSDMRITTLERDLDESQSSVTELRAELTKAREKLRWTEEALCRVENDKTALERRTADEIKSLQRAISSKDEELMQLSGGVDAGLAQEREDELIRRVEEEEAKVLALEQLLSETQSSKAMEGALQKAEKRVAAETSKVRGLEEKNTALNRDVKRVRDALEETRSQVQGFKVALDDSNSLVQALQERETCAITSFLLTDTFSSFFRALTAQLNSRKETIRSLRDTQSGGSLI
jgi:septal ring factor EnvC (AmiA/AmiB activator)